jgi:hypothetical protein
MMLLGLAAMAVAAEPRTSQIVNGLEIYFGLMPAQLVRGHAPGRLEQQMHGGPRAGENHVMVALFDAKSGRRISDAVVHATITGPKGFRAEKPLEPMTIAGAATFGNYFEMLGIGPYKIALRVRPAGASKDVFARFSWSR